jgi:hypothetical protein
MNSISKLALILVLIVVNSNSTLAQSDAEKQMRLKEMLDAMGYKNYNNSHFIQWESVGRKLFWDKWTGDVRENPAKQTILQI